jgi:Cu+-exporting ATPase
MTIGQTPLRLMQFALTTLVLAGPGAVFYRLGIPALLRRAPDMNSLVVLGTAAAWAWSTLVTFAPTAVPEAGRHVYFEAAAVIVTLILLGPLAGGARAWSVRARRSPGSSRCAPTPRHGSTPVPAARGAVGRGRTGRPLLLRPGARVAVDGVVVSGESHVDEAMLTGEPLPGWQGPGDRVTAGTVNGNGSLTYRATAVGADTVLARIVAMVEDAQAARLPVQSLIDRVTAVFVPVVLAIAVLAGALWLLLGADPSKALVVTVSVLIIACPCAMGLATPVSILAGTGRAAELGVLFRQGRALQALGDVDLVAFDKTGTLTEGRPTVTRLDAAPGTDPDDLLMRAASVEAASEHPLARAIVAEAEARGLQLRSVTGFQNTAGGGVVADLDGTRVMVGASRHLQGSGVSVPVDPDGPETRVHVAADGRHIGRIDLSDPPKADAARGRRGAAPTMACAWRCCRAMGRGRSRRSHTLGVAEAHAGLSPEGKKDHRPLAQGRSQGRLRRRRHQRRAGSGRCRCGRCAGHRHGCRD